MTITAWRTLLLLCLCCHYEIQPAACKPPWMRSQFPCDVTASNTAEVLFDCKGRGLLSVPFGITTNATKLDLSENSIKNISVDSFSNLLNLTQLTLNMANNKDPVMIAPNAFRNLTKLRELRLIDNRLKEIPGNLSDTVKYLDLSINHIMLLDNRSLAGLTHLTHLLLQRNCDIWNPCGRSVTIMEGSFAVMTTLLILNLSWNNLTEVPRGLPKSLHRLHLGSNRIQEISKDDLQLPNLIVLQIEGNCPRCTNAPYPCVPCQNDSLSIHPNAFDNLTQLTTLNLGGNSLDHLNPSWFMKLKKLRRLFLMFNFLINAITGQAPFLTHLPTLTLIDISFNFGLRSYPTTLNLSKDFSKLVALTSLHLEGLVFQNIGTETLSPLYNLPNLSLLNLGTNFIIHSKSTIFQKFINLKLIYLAENRLYPSHVKMTPQPSDGDDQGSDLFASPLNKPHPKVCDYELSHRLIKRECFDSGRVLDLSSNNLFFITPKQFQGYENIACLNLSGNGFSAAPNGTEFSTLPNLTYLDLSFNKIDLAYDNAFNELKQLKVLDLSNNDHYFKAYGITHNLNFTQNLPALRVLNMSHNSISTLTTKRMYSKSLTELQFTQNRLGTLWKENDGSYEMLFTNLTNLTILDISCNTIAKIPDSVYEYLPPNLITLRINHNSLTDFTWDKLKFFHQLQILDLSFNSLSNVTSINSNISLTFLDLSHNNIFHLDNWFLKGAKSLTTLNLSNNKLTTINQSTFQSKSQIQTLFLQKNPFQCTCDSLDFILWIENSGVKIPRLTTEVTCDTQANQKVHALIYFDIKQCVNDSQAFLIYTFTHSFIIIFLFMATVAHLFYWDVSYVLQYMKAKLKGYRSLNLPDCVYDVFVTYDTRDPHVSEWVMTNLRVELEEEGDKRLPLCLEERDWPPGAPLVENLAHSIRYSRKTLFVLTEAFVRTGVFKLAMCMAHQRLLDENVDVIMLLMLQPVLQHSHFLRLRRRMCEKSVLEWPRTAAAEPWFWQTLRNVVRVDNQVICNKTYSKYFTIK
ncbi:toll-like receptor 8 [Pseudoliparis swirei]|uniref:toll-like receptor 8 n=1 Tax=Pseudoliparis swirei TaxID=2059687 RepID=UPI0024BEE50E|nr:toll-like receptor 8 [Pseudoliparis swirei]